jgi:hypothetical protein
MRGAVAGLARVALLLLAGFFTLIPAGAETAKPLCVDCLRIRVGLPRVVRGPEAHIADDRFSEIQLPGGRFRGFSANAVTYAIDGPAVWAMGGPAVPVLGRGPKGSYASCGRWIQHVERAGDELVAWVHDETACNYKIGQTHKSMSLAVSRDDGLTWQDRGLVITGTDSPATGKMTGEGDCTAIDGRDGYYYAYCRQPRDRAIFVARAPIANPGSGSWKKYDDGSWSESGLGGTATNLGSKLTSSVARWNANGATILLGDLRQGPGLFFSSDRTTFTALKEPLLDTDRGIWHRPDPSEVMAYADLVDAATGENQLGDSWYLVYTYVQPDETFAQRYVVFRPVDVTISASPVHPQVGVLLARWYNPSLHDRWSTTAPVPGNYDSYRLDAKLGYLTTMPDPGKPAIALEDCVLLDGAHPDHFLAQKGACESQGYRRLRTAGWVYQRAEPDTEPLYQCFSAGERSHFASNRRDCDGDGTMQRLLGYVLVR